jgi:predicted secreted protein
MGRKVISLFFLLVLAFQIINYQPVFGVQNTWSYNYNELSDTANPIALVQTADGGYVVLANTNYLEKNCWLLKITDCGEVKWTRTITLPTSDFLWSLTATTDGGFALAGEKDFSTLTNNINSLNSKGIDFWLIKADIYGKIEWNQTYGGGWHEGAYAIVNTSDDGYALAGYTWSFDPNGYLLVKTNANGTLQWSKSYDNTYGATELIQTSDGGFVLGGTNGQSVKVVKTDENGLEEWSTNLGESSQNKALSIVENSDGGYLVLGHASTGFLAPQVLYCWISKISSTGHQEWFKSIEGNYFSLAKSSNNGFVLAGSLNSSNCLVSIDALGIAQWVKPLGNFNGSRMTSLIGTVNGFVVAGIADDSTNGGRIIWVIRTDNFGNAPQNLSDAPTSDPENNPVISDLESLVLIVLGVATVFIVLAVLGTRFKSYKFHSSP